MKRSPSTSEGPAGARELAGPGPMNWLVRNRLLLLIVFLVLLLIIAFFGGPIVWIICGVLAVAAVVAYAYAGSLITPEIEAPAIQNPEATVIDLTETPLRESF